MGHMAIDYPRLSCNLASNQKAQPIIYLCSMVLKESVSYYVAYITNLRFFLYFVRCFYSLTVSSLGVNWRWPQLGSRTWPSDLALTNITALLPFSQMFSVMFKSIWASQALGTSAACAPWQQPRNQVVCLLA